MFHVGFSTGSVLNYNLADCFRTSSTTRRPTRALSLCPGSQCKRQRQQLLWGKPLIRYCKASLQCLTTGLMGWHLYVSHRQKRSSGEDVPTGTIGKKVSPLPRRDARQIYNPPSGKYSASIGNFSYGEFGELGITRLVLWTVTTQKRENILPWCILYNLG